MEAATNIGTESTGAQEKSETRVKQLGKPNVFIDEIFKATGYEVKNINGFYNFCGISSKILNERDEKFAADVENCQFYDNLIGYFFDGQTDWDKNKGILVVGNTGSGKTFAFRVIAEMYGNLYQGHQPFLKLHAAKISKRYSSKGIDVLDKPISAKRLFIDDLGQDELEKHYGNSLDVIGHIITMRYENFTVEQNFTFGTTNFGIDQLAEKYDERVLSRIQHMFNIVGLGSKEKSKDRRK